MQVGIITRSGPRSPRVPTPKTLQKFVIETAATGATVYTDDAKAYKGMPFDHESVRHSVGEYVAGMAHTNGIESFWSMLKRAHKGVYHKISAKHLQTLRGRVRGPPWCP